LRIRKAELLALTEGSVPGRMLFSAWLLLFFSPFILLGISRAGASAGVD